MLPSPALHLRRNRQSFVEVMELTDAAGSSSRCDDQQECLTMTAQAKSAQFLPFWHIVMGIAAV